MDAAKEAAVVNFLREMPEGLELTLEELNKHIGCTRYYDLYEILQKHCKINYLLFSFLGQDPIEKSVLLRKFLR